MESPCECGIEPPSSINPAVSWLIIKEIGRPRRRWENNISMDLKDICIITSNGVDSTQDRDYWRALVNAALNHRGSLAMELVR